MPPKAKMLSKLIDVDSEDEFARPDEDMMLTPDSALENNAKSRKKIASRATSKVTKAKAPVKKAVAATKPKKSAPAGRKVLAHASETEEVEEFDDDDMKREHDDEESEPEPRPVKRGKATATKSAATKAKSRKVVAAQESEVEEEEVVRKPKTTAKAFAKSKTAKVSKRAGSVIRETQPEPMEVDESTVVPEEEAEEEEEEVDDPTPKPAPRAAPSRARSASRQRQPFRRTGSASDTERTNDPALRRKLGDITRQLENVQLKYSNLREVGTKDAETNFDKLRRTTDQRAKAQDDIIASLKKELAAQKSLASEIKSLRNQVTSLTSENTRLTSENQKLTHSLQESQAENKQLNARLAAARSTPAPEPRQVPGSAVKKQEAQKALAPAAAEAAVMKLKEELYADLTGLILNGVKKLDGEDVYDCIQTGRNGTLHFHLSISSSSSANSAELADAEFAYTPLLDEKNDRELIEILPDYLTEEICFPRSSASKFYAKVVDCMTKKVVLEE